MSTRARPGGLRRSRPQSARGAILIHIAIAILVLTAFSAFVLDYGVMWLSRRQAQNAADAGALAGAVARAFDETEDPPSADGPAYQAASSAASLNAVFGSAPGVAVSWDCPSFTAGGRCVRVDVFRDGTNGSADLPVFLAPLFGVSSQGARATATALVLTANSTNCLKPWAVIDRWLEHWVQPVTPWNVESTFDKYKQNGDLDPQVADPDVYVSPTESDPGSGFHPFDADQGLTSDFGLELTLKSNNANMYNAGWFQALQLTCPGGNCFKDNIKYCSGVTYTIGQTLSYDVATEQGNKVGPTNQGVYDDPDSLCQRDSGAYWDPTLNEGHGGIAGSTFKISPRLVAVPLISPEDATTTKNGRTTVTIQNIMGFFVECPEHPPNGAVIGRMMTMPGLVLGPSNSGGSGSSFLMSISLVR